MVITIPPLMVSVFIALLISVVVLLVLKSWYRDIITCRRTRIGKLDEKLKGVDIDAYFRDEATLHGLTAEFVKIGDEFRAGSLGNALCFAMKHECTNRAKGEYVALSVAETRELVTLIRHIRTIERMYWFVHTEAPRAFNSMNYILEKLSHVVGMPHILERPKIYPSSEQ